MSKESYIEGDYIETTGGNNKTFAKGIIENISLESLFIQNAKGEVFYTTNDKSPGLSVATIVNAYVAKLQAGKYVKINSASVGEEVYVFVSTTGLVGKKIEVNLIDSEGILANKSYTSIDLLQDNKDVNGLLSTTVNQNGAAIFKVKLQPTVDAKDSENWVKKISDSKNKKVKLCILVDARKHNPDLEITYFGTNPKEHEGDSQVSKKPNFWLDQVGKWFELSIRKCYCIEMGLTNKHCGGNGTIATKENYKVLSKELQAEEAAVYAVSKQESSGGGFMNYDKKKYAKILYERHYMYRNLKDLKGKVVAEQEMGKNSYVVNSEGGKYVYNSKGNKEANENIASREKLSVARKIDEESAIKSCSWGAFQIMGQFYDKLYLTPKDLEKAQDMCELQQIAYFKAYLLKERTSALKALRNKNWEQFTYYYNGAGWEKNNSHYPVNMKKYYEEY